MNTRISHVALVAIISCLLVPNGQAAIVTSFDSNLEGWTATGGALAYVPTGGNPSGYLSLTDNTNSWMTVFAPSAYHGNLSGFMGGTLTFDVKNLSGATPNLVRDPKFGTITITGSNGSASLVLGGTGNPPADGIWHTYSTVINPGLWTGDLVNALTNVTQLSIVLESNETVPAEINGFDNFRIAAVPVPAAIWLFSSALVSVRLVGKIKSTRKSA